MGFGHIVGSDYYAYAGPAQPLATAAGEELNIRDRDFICLIQIMIYLICLIQIMIYLMYLSDLDYDLFDISV